MALPNVLQKIVLSLLNPSMLTAAADCTSDFWLTEHYIKGDLDMTVREEELNEKKVYEDWGEGEEDEDVDFVDLYRSASRDGNGSEDSDRIYGEEEREEEEEEAMEQEEEGQEGEKEEEEEKVLSGTFIKSKDEDIDMMEKKRFLAGNAHLIIDLEAATMEDAVEQGIKLEEMDEIDSEMD
ncbi:hypothetical protein HOY80DRAFT_997743 [Tuber brumale]|nr:hypothetical protein HOY80DRAFT_997743 [Tuber brumale]